MDANQIKILRECYQSESTGVNGEKDTLGRYLKYVTDVDATMTTTRDLVFVDMDNQMVHCAFVNDDQYSQANYPVKVITAPFEHIHAMESILTKENFMKLVNEGFLMGLTNDTQKEFIKKWVERINIQAQQAVRATPFFPSTAKVVDMPNNEIDRDDGITGITNGTPIGGIKPSDSETT